MNTVREAPVRVMSLVAETTVCGILDFFNEATT
jgi:hypothetical protein